MSKTHAKHRHNINKIFNARRAKLLKKLRMKRKGYIVPLYERPHNVKEACP